MANPNDVFTTEQIWFLSVRAVNELIADAEAGRLKENKELAETIAVCIRHTSPSALRTLKWLLDQCQLERPHKTVVFEQGTPQYTDLERKAELSRLTHAELKARIEATAISTLRELGYEVIRRDPSPDSEKVAS